MSEKNKKLPLLVPDNFGANDPKNPQNIDVEKILENARKKRENELQYKKISGVDIDFQKKIS